MKNVILVIMACVLFSCSSFPSSGKKQLSDNLAVAAKNGDLQDVEIAIGKGADINKTSKSGETPLFKASSYDHADIVNALIAAGADVNIQKNDGMTALMITSKRGRTGRCLQQGRR